MKCIINGDHFTFKQVLSIQEIIKELKLDEDRIIVQYNENLVQQQQFSKVQVNDDDCLELLEFVGGG
ncbi:sulfur carrier protein ThiS [Staphylococcus nepalensis]|uniref:sulfur carrier protein ThiS n=1 Tax=Staphylococcus nepalensis TaxID=214473 RepID=UPI002300D0E3|nr:sulfur carrier protein ThiS [Staphylococcus nepalensis]